MCKRTILPGILIASTLLFSGCLLYNPHVSPVIRPLEQGEFEVGVDAGTLPRYLYAESNENGQGGPEISVQADIDYGVTDRLAIGARIWGSLDTLDRGVEIDGITLDGSLLLADPMATDVTRLGLQGQLHYGWMDIVSASLGHPGPGTGGFDTTIISSFGIGGGLHARFPSAGPVEPFTALNAGFRTQRSGSADDDPNNRLDPLNFYTASLHLGGGIDITEHLNFVLELTGLLEIPDQRFSNDQPESQFLILPMVGLGWRL